MINLDSVLFAGLRLADLVGLIFVAGTVWGIKLMSSPATAVKGNCIGAVSVLGAVILTLTAEGIIGVWVLWVAILIGSVIGCLLAFRVAMIQMPQLVALLNGFGGGSSAIVSLLTLFTAGALFERSTAALGLVVGAVTLSGSLVAAGKLHGKITQRSVAFTRQVNLWLLILMVVFGVLAASNLSFGKAASFMSLAVSLAYGILFTLQVGGADMPITVSLLNSLSGLAASLSGFAVRNPLLVAIGAVVGASGLILTNIMCRAMNRSLAQVLSGRTMGTAGGLTDRRQGQTDPAPESQKESPGSPTEAAIDLPARMKSARSVIIVPGYGMAIAQAQSAVKALMDRFEANGANVRVAIHPVAGRMPGHMNVLLAEVDVPYEKLFEMDAINDEFRNTDLVVVIGANDVINPAANTAEGTPIYGMPVLNVADARHIIICNFDTKPGYAGVENPLYSAPNVTLVLGDARETVKDLVVKFDSVS